MDDLSLESTCHGESHKAAIQVAFVTLGCAKNEVDTDRMRALLLSSAFEVTDDTLKADIVVVNTCSFLTAATEEGIATTLELLQEKADLQEEVCIVLAGCIPSRYSIDELNESLPEVKAFIPSDQEDNLVNYLESVVLSSKSLAARYRSVQNDQTQDNLCDDLAKNRVLRTVEAPFAYVKISEGCDRFCSFCAIPSIRGHYHSRPAQEILHEVSSLLGGGVREIVLIGQDTGIWGSDFGTSETLATLLADVAACARPYGAWVRVLYLQPEGLTDELLDTMANTPEILNYFDIPIQHCNERILTAMNRSGSYDEYLAMIDRLRSKIPGITLRTTVIAGFPGETDEQADELAHFLEQAEFDYCGVFMYSAEEGTRAFDMEGHLSEDVKLERAQRIQDIADSIGFARAAQHVGEVCEVLIDSYEELEDGSYELCGRTQFQSPDTDGVVHLIGNDYALGDKVIVTIEDSFCYELTGVIHEG